jgi:phosphoesterase RecJ-like protein
MESSNTPAINPETLSQQALADLSDLFHTKNRFLIVSHERPDGDAIGSTAGLLRSLRKAGKTVTASLSTPMPDNFAFLLETELTQPVDAVKGSYDAILVLDPGDLPRTGFAEYLQNTDIPVVNIDHHPSNNRFGKLNVLDFHACSTCEMILHILKSAQLPLDREVAEALYLGLLTDSRFFQNENLRPQAHLAAAALLETGLDTGPILGRLNRQRKVAELRILGRGLSKLQMSSDGRFAEVTITRHDLQETGAVLENIWACGLFGHLTSIRDVVVGAAFMENPEGKCFCELRSVGGFDVKSIAVEMGGGGHLAASGCNRIGGLDDFSTQIRKKIIDRLALKSLDKHDKQPS